MGNGHCRRRRRHPPLPPPPPPPPLPPPPPPPPPPSHPPPRPPHNFEVIIKEADSASAGNLEANLFSGIFLNQRRKKYWVDEKSGSNCFMLFARELSITWGNDPRYWRWFSSQDTSDDAGVEVVRLLDVCWLEIHGKFEASHLTPGRTYEVAFVVMIDDDSYGWDVPVNLKLVAGAVDVDGDHHVQRRQEVLAGRPKGEWVELPAGVVKVGDEAMSGEVKFSLFEYEDGGWKRGLVVKGVCIRPKN